MSSEGSQVAIVLIRPRPKVGGGQTEVLHLDPPGEESLVSRHDYPGNQNWSEDLSQVLKDSFDEGLDKVIIDLVDVKWVNSTGLGILMSLYREIENGGGTVAIANPSPKVAGLFKVTKLDRYFRVADSLDEAVGKLE